MDITEKEYNKFIRTIEMQDARIKALEATVERLTNELRKYKNENTPSSMTPPFVNLPTASRGASSGREIV